MNSGLDKKSNIRRAKQLVLRACRNGAGLIVLPEVFTYRGPLGLKNQKEQIADTMSGPLIKEFSTIAREKSACIVPGSFYEPGRDKKRFYNTMVVISATGEIAAVYRKKHLFKACLRTSAVNEDRHFIAGKKAATAKLGPFRLGCAICYDLRFPDMFQEYYKKGCNVLVVPSAFTHETGKAHWETLLRARAIETRSYVLAPDQYGNGGNGVMAHGNSMIIDPWGTVLARAKTAGTEILYAELALEEIQKARQRLP